MALSNLAVFAQKPMTGTVVVTGAAGAINSDAPTGVSLLMTAGQDGAILTRLWAIPRGTVGAGSLLLFIQGTDGAVRLIDSEALAAFTSSTTVALPETVFSNYSENTPLRLAAGDKLYVGNQVAAASGMVFRAEWTNF